MSEIIKMVKFKTNVSFVGSDGVLHFGGSVVQLPREDFDGQAEVCEQFGLVVPELIEEIDVVVEESKKPADEKSKDRDGKDSQSKDKKSEGDNEVDVPEL